MRILLATAALLATSLPGHAVTETEFCQWMQRIFVENLGGGHAPGTRLGNATTYLGTVVTCSTRSIDFRKRIDVPFSALDARDAGGREHEQARWNKVYCAEPVLAKSTRNLGWRILSTTWDAEGKLHVIEVRCK